MKSPMTLAALAALIAISAPAHADIVTGPDETAPPTVAVFANRSGEFVGDFQAFGPGFVGGVRVATGDINNDGTPDIITGAGPGMLGGHVRVFDGLTNALIRDFAPFEDTQFSGGVFVASGDINSDGTDDIVVGTGAGGGPHVRVFSGTDSFLLMSFEPFQASFTGGVRVAVGDVNGDSLPEIVVSPGAGMSGGPHVRVFNVTGNPGPAFFPYGTSFQGGVFVAAGDVNDDGVADIITAPGMGGGPHVLVFDGRTGAAAGEIFAYDPNFLGGVRVASGDVTGDGVPDIITGPGPGGGPHVKVFNGLTLEPAIDFFAYPSDPVGGVFVANFCNPLNCAQPPIFVDSLEGN